MWGTVGQGVGGNRKGWGMMAKELSFFSRNENVLKLTMNTLKATESYILFIYFFVGF